MTVEDASVYEKRMLRGKLTRERETQMKKSMRGMKFSHSLGSPSLSILFRLH